MVLLPTQVPSDIKTLLQSQKKGLKFDEFDAAVNAEAAKVELETVAFAINQFKVKKIKYPY